MKKNLLSTVLTVSFLSQTVYADNLTMPPESIGIPAANISDSSGENIKTIVKYLKNLGAYLGFDLTKEPDPNDKSTQLINPEERQGALLNLINTSLGAIPVPGSEQGQKGTFVPATGNISITASINELANAVFSIPKLYNTASTDTISVNPKVDQRTFESDPVSQSVFNLLTTPDRSFCMDANGQWLPTRRGETNDCAYLYQGQVVGNVIGKYPKPDDSFSNDFNQPLVPQLNANSLIAPLMYSYQGTGSQSDKDTDKSKKGLDATNQAQEAANFVRYAISDVLPLSLANKTKYADLYSNAVNAENNTSFVEQKKAQNILGNYLVGLRVFAAQRSVASANLYGMLARRIPQMSQSETNTKPVSEALSEFTMAAWRLKDLKDTSGKTPNQQWLQQINKASSATVQKEIAVLLAEINYQMYLSRQQQERILLTNTMILMQNMKDNAPSLAKSIEEANGSGATVKGLTP